MNRFPELYDIFLAKKARDDRKHQEYMAERDAVKKTRSAEIVKALVEYRVDEKAIWTNGYAYHFDYNGWYVSFVDQESRFCCTQHLLPQSDEEKEMIVLIRWHHDDSGGVEGQIMKAFRYRDFIVNGQTGASLVYEMMERLFDGKESK